MKKFLTLNFLLILLISIAACGGAAPESAAPAEEAAPAQEEEVAAEAEPVEAMEVAGTIRIGAAVSETGKYAREGKDTRQGYNLWLDWVNNEKGGIQVGDELYEVEIVYYDDEGDPDTTAKLVETLITEDEVDFLLGPYSSGLTKSASAISEKYDVLMVEGNGASESLFERGFQNLFAVLTPAGNYTQSALQMLADKGAQSVVIAYEDTAFPTSVAEGAQRWAEEYGLEVLAVETYPKDVADVSGIMTKFRDLNPDVFVGGGHFNDALLFTRAAKELDFNPKAMVITVGPSNPEFVAEMGTDANYIIGPTQWEAVMAYEDQWLGTAAQYAERYQAMWSESPTYQAAESTATALALMVAIENAGSLETADVRQALNDLDITTFYGPINFDDTGKNAAKPMGSIQVQDGDIKVIAPGQAAETDIVYPMPPWSEREAMVGAMEEEASEEAAMEVAGTIRIGAAVSETGKYAREGKDTRQGYNLWLDWVNNEKGGIQVGDELYEVEIVYYDDEGDPDTTAKLVETLITEDEVDFLLGPYSSGLTKSASAISEKYDVLMVEGNGASESLFERGFQNLFAVLTPAGNYTQSALQMLADKGAQSVVIAYEDTAFPTSVAEGAQRWAEEYGLEVLAVETYPKDVADVSGIMTKFRDLNPDVFVGGGHFNDALLFTRAAKELDFNPKAMVITVGPSNPEFVAEMGTDANYIIGPTQWEAVMAYEDQWLGTAAQYAERYQAMWSESPTYQAAESTATALALMVAIENAGSLETADVRQALNRFRHHHLLRSDQL